MEAILDRMRGGLVVSCQASAGPMRDSATMARIAQAVVLGGAVAVRVQGLGDISKTVAAVEVPVIGLWKVGGKGVYITPTLEHAIRVAAAGADIVAIDGTRRDRPDGLSLKQTINELRTQHDVLVMADCGSLDNIVAADAAGADLIATTLAGYTGERPYTNGPDLDLVRQATGRVGRPIVAEGRFKTPQQAAQALELGAFAVCVGTAITNPSAITSWFLQAMSRGVR